jgi:hypothetical protein
MKRITVFIGNFGSGKTELSINTALALKKERQRVTLVDLDIINPYFKSSFRRDTLEKAGVRVVAPGELGTVPPEVASVFDDPAAAAVFDVGGDPVGATVLGRYHERFDAVREDTETLYVVNFMRPMSDTPPKVLQMMEEIEARSRMRVTGLINNTNLAAQTTADDLLTGQRLLSEVAAARGLPIRWVSGRRAVLDAFAQKAGGFAGELYPIDIHMRAEWMDM